MARPKADFPPAEAIRALADDQRRLALRVTPGARVEGIEIGESVVSPDVYAELVRSSDEGVAEFLDLARVKPNTLGNTRMLKIL